MARRLMLGVLVVIVAGSVVACSSLSNVGNPPAAKAPRDEAALHAPTEFPLTPTPTAEVVDNLTAPSPTATLPSPTAAPTRTPTPPTPTPVEVTPRPSPPPPPSDGGTLLIERIHTGKKEIALSFDAGADRGHAAQILDTLDRYHVKGNFGVTANWAQANPDLFKRMVREGHMVFNHTYDHKSFTGYSTGTQPLSHGEIVDELQSTQKVFRDLAGFNPAPYWRPPYGDYDDASLQAAADAGYYVTLMWTCDTLGWKGATVDQIIQRCTDPARAGPGGDIMMHVGSQSADWQALPRLIEILESEGYHIVTIDQMLRDGDGG